MTTATFGVIANPLDGEGSGAAYSPTLNRIVAVGSGTPDGIASSDDGGLTWTGRAAHDASDVVWAAGLNKFLTVGDRAGISSDGITWAFHNIGPFFFGTGAAWSGSVFVVVGSGYSSYYSSAPSNNVWTSLDGITFTGRGAPGGAGFDQLEGVAWSPTLGLFAAADFSGHVMTSPNGITWTTHGRPLNSTGRGMRWLPNAGMFVMPGHGVIPSATYAYSTNGTVWNLASTPLDSRVADDVCELGSTIYLGGTSSDGLIKIIQSADGGVTWTDSATAIDGLSSAFLVQGLLALPTTTEVLALANAPTATMMLGGQPLLPASPRFYEGYDWRWIVTNLSGETQTFLDPLAMNRQITYTLNDSTVATCDLPSDNPEVNITGHDGDPFVSNANRLLYAFRREEPGTNQPWVCRFAGLIEELNDEIQPTTDAPVTHLTAYDPWHYLDSMPVTDNKYLGDMPGQGGVTYPANGIWTAARVVVDVIENAVLFNFNESLTRSMPFSAQHLFIDYASGHVPPGVTDPTPPLTANVNFQQGMTIGDALRQMVVDGLCDILFTPIYPMVTDPHDPSYGALCKLNVYQLAGQEQNAAIMAWDMPTNSLVGLNRLESATTLGNHAMIATGLAGVPAVAAPNTASTRKYGPYWYIDSVSGKVAYPDIVQILAQAQVLQRAFGAPTIALDPSTERAPIPLLDYGLGDSIPLYTSNRFRETIFPVLNLTGTGWDGLARVWTIPISMPDDAPETVIQMTVQVFPVPPQPVFDQLQIRITTVTNATGAAITRATRRIGGQVSQRTVRRLATMYGHLSGYGYGT